MSEGCGSERIFGWKAIFKNLGFVPTELGGMEGRVEDIEISAIDHPFMGVSVTATYLSARTVAQFENFIPKECSIEMVGKLFVHIIEQIHPDKFKKPLSPPKPERKRPSNEEALAKMPDLLRQFHATLDEMSFLFQRPLIPSGYMDQKIGEVLVAYVYDLELTRNQTDFSEATSSDGRSVQVRTTRAQAQRESISLPHVCEHLLVVQLWGRELIEAYNGPLEPIWEASKGIQKDGTRRISMGRLRGHNRYAVPPEQRIEPKRTWRFDTKIDDP